MGTTTAANAPTEPRRRERKKEATRLALHRAAVLLAGEQGLEHVTVEAIADAADVSRRTFSNYFANKEEAILWGDVRRLTRMYELVAARPPTEPIWAALSAGAEQLLVERDADPDWVRQLRLLRRHPSLIGRQVATFAEGERTLADLVVDRLPDGPHRDVRARLMTAALFSAVRIATQTSIAQPERPLLDVLHELLAAAAEPWS